MVQSKQMLAYTEYRGDFTLRHSLQSTFSLPGQKFSKHTLPLVKNVNSPVWTSQQIPLKQRSLIITEVNSSLYTAHHGKVRNFSNTLSLFFNHRLSLL